MNREYGPIEFTPEVEREAEIIYSLLMGEYKPEQLSPQALRVQNFCAVGTPFSALYDEMLDAYDRLSERLHPGEDQDEDVPVRPLLRRPPRRISPHPALRGVRGQREITEFRY